MANYSKQQFARRARLLKWTVYLVMAMMVASQLLYLVAPNLGLLQFRAPPEYQRLPPTVATLLRAAAALAWLFSFWFLARMLKPLERGEFFAGSLTRNLRAFAGCLVVALGIPGLVVPVVGYLTGACPTTGPCLRAFELNSRTLFLMIVAVLIFLVARLLDEARRIEDENKQIV